MEIYSDITSWDGNISNICILPIRNLDISDESL